MNWKNLKQNKCPKCSKELFVRSTGMISCDNPKCDFKIKPAKMNEIVNSMVSAEMDAPNYALADEEEKDYNEP